MTGADTEVAYFRIDMPDLQYKENSERRKTDSNSNISKQNSGEEVQYY